MTDAPELRRLPDRRPVYPVTVEWSTGTRTRHADFDIGTDREGRVCEIFVRGLRIGGDEMVDNTACFIFASKLLRLGFSPEELLRWIAQDESGAQTGVAAPSAVEVALRCAAERQEDGPAIAWLHGNAPLPKVSADD